MRKWLIICSIVFLPVLKATGQTLPHELISQIKKSKQDTNLLKLQLKLGNYYLVKPHAYKNDLDSTRNFFDQALQLSIKLQSEKFEYETFKFLGRYCLDAGDIFKARIYFSKVISYYQKKGDEKALANTFFNFGDWLPDDNNTNILFKLQYFEQARLLFLRLNSPGEIKILLKIIADLYVELGNYVSAENSMLKLISFCRATHQKEMFREYDQLASIYKLEGNPQKELLCRLNAAKNIEDTGDTVKNSVYYYNLALLYNDLKMYKESLVWNNKAGLIEKRKPDHDGFYLQVLLSVLDLIADNKAQKALVFLKKTIAEVVPQNDLQSAIVNECFGNCYSNLKLFERAGHHYTRMMKNFDLFYSKHGLQSTAFQSYLVHFNRVMATYFILIHQYVKADANLKKILALPKGSVRALTLITIYELQFKVDSAMGNYIPAIRNFALHKKMNDSVFNVAKEQQINEMQTRYETDKKEQSIKALQSQARSQQAMLQKVNLQKRITIAGVILLFVVAGLTYYGYRQKQKSNVNLQEKQKEINQQNITLQQLVTDKDGLLTEKDWLLKEVHHRVKNNLQIVMSLLSTQSAYLKNNAAHAAIRESQNRVQTISLIHQRLYKANNLASIDMSAYIGELINYLSDSFDTKKKLIRFEQLIESIQMDIAQAIPVGLILNEAVTNAIKYAFGGTCGDIIIAMQNIGNHNVLLTIADTGKGLPDDFDVMETASLGMEMMKALSKQLGGSFAVKNTPGVTISVEFPVEKIFQGNKTEDLYA